MSDILPEERTAEPSQGVPEETEFEQRDAEEPGFERREGHREEGWSEPGAGEPAAGATAEAPSDEERGLSAEEPENAGHAPLVAGHTADDPATDEAAGQAPLVAGHTDYSPATSGNPAADETGGTWSTDGSPTATPANAGRDSALEDAAVFDTETATSFRQRWSTILTEFIDDPRRAVEDADRFVADVAQAFASGVESRRQRLTSAREHDGADQTEELRLTMRQYRMLVDRILTVSATAD